MKIYTDILLIAVIAIYIVDLSGFTQSWRSAIARWLTIPENALRPLPPFDCSKCTIWWTAIIYAICTAQLNLPILAYIAAISFLAIPIQQIMIFIYEGILFLVNKMMKWYE